MAPAPGQGGAKSALPPLDPGPALSLFPGGQPLVQGPTAAVVTQGRLPDNFTSILQLSKEEKKSTENVAAA